MNERQMYYFLAVKEILELFAEQELGNHCEINIPAVLNYLQSFNFANDCWGLKTKDEIYQLVTDDILEGCPIWQLLIIPKWTRNMLERELTKRQEQARKELEKKYKCYTCCFFKETETSLGIYNECIRPKDKKIWSLERRDCFEPKIKCKFYCQKSDEA